MPGTIEVKSHVARDLLQSAQVFNTPGRVAWEYVSNALDNPSERQTSVTCRVEIVASAKRMKISDDARGMSRSGLQNFFTMHAENVRRKAGLAARGRFGTGKSAAFGIGKKLHIVTVHEGLLNEVELTRDDIDTAKDGERFPVRDIRVDESVRLPNGTTVTVEGIHLPLSKLDPTQVKSHIERHMGRHHQNNSVWVNSFQCEFQEPAYSEERFFDAPPELEKDLGKSVRCRICYSPVPIEDASGIDVFSRGIYHATTLAGSEGREQANHLFGEVEVPRLEDAQDTEVPPPFDNTRRSELNELNRTVGVLLAWLQECIEEVRTDWVKKDQERRRGEEAKRLAREASEIAKILNDDFREYQDELARASRSSGGDLGPLKVLRGEPGPGEVLPGEGDQPTEFHAGHATKGGDTPHLPGDRDGDVAGGGPNLIPGASTGSEQTPQGTQRRPRGGFQVDFKHMTERVFRSTYEPDKRLIIVNLDHPQVAAAVGGEGGIHGKEFRKLAYEIAFTEYAVAVARSQWERQGEAYDAQDALTDVRQVIDRVARRAFQVFLA